MINSDHIFHGIEQIKVERVDLSTHKDDPLFVTRIYLIDEKGNRVGISLFTEKRGEQVEFANFELTKKLPKAS